MKRSILIIAIVVLAVGVLVVVKQLTRPPAETAANGGTAAGLLPGSALAACLQNDLPTMADFGAGTCKVCKELQPVIDAAADRYKGKANIVYVDTGIFPTITKQYDVRLIPTQIFFDSRGNEVTRNVGKISPEEIDRQLAALGAEP
jgi:thioredoxin 1